MTVLQILKNSQEKNAFESYFSAVTGLAILLRKNLTGVFVKTFQIIYVTLLDNNSIVNSHSFFPVFPASYLKVGTRGGGLLTSSEFYVGNFPG